MGDITTVKFKMLNDKLNKGILDRWTNENISQNKHFLRDENLNCFLMLPSFHDVLMFTKQTLLHFSQTQYSADCNLKNSEKISLPNERTYQILSLKTK